MLFSLTDSCLDYLATEKKENKMLSIELIMAIMPIHKHSDINKHYVILIDNTLAPL